MGGAVCSAVIMLIKTPRLFKSRHSSSYLWWFQAQCINNAGLVMRRRHRGDSASCAVVHHCLDFLSAHITYFLMVGHKSQSHSLVFVFVGPGNRS